MVEWLNYFGRMFIDGDMVKLCFATVGMVCQSCYISGGHSEVVYTRHMTVVGPSF